MLSVEKINLRYFTCQVILIAAIIILCLIIKYDTISEKYRTNKFKSNVNKNVDLRQNNYTHDHNKHPIYYPLEYNYGYSDADHPIFSAHPNKLVPIKELGQMKYIKLNSSGGVIYTGLNRPLESSCKIKCPNHIVDVLNNNSKKSITCYV